MGYIFNLNDAESYDNWYNKPENKFIYELENKLMVDMLEPMHGCSILDIGCGIGLNFSILFEKGLKVTGIDPSQPMLDLASNKWKNRVDLHHGFAEDLPFDDNSFNYAVLITSLEFVDDPLKALEEACRVAKDKIFLGVLNRYAIKGIKRRLKGLFTETIYNKARFFSIWELKQMIHCLVGDVPTAWKTVSELPRQNGKLVSLIEQF
ncbi:MAG: methyltransferase domain-containing protein, partial [Desulfobacterales bacterium]|nr:methyltransferase domain-containing protein [Desulfobacterales bacterium]